MMILSSLVLNGHLKETDVRSVMTIRYKKFSPTTIVNRINHTTDLRMFVRLYHTTSN